MLCEAERALAYSSCVRPDFLVDPTSRAGYGVNTAFAMAVSPGLR